MKGTTMATTTKHSRTRLADDSYMSLVRRFPLRPLKSEKSHALAVEMIGELFGRKLDSGASDYLDTLILLVNKYEDENHSASIDLTPQEALLAIMQANNLTQKDMGKIIGSEPSVSMFLMGKRDLSKTHIKALSERFRIDPLLFM